jgi:hypothetical protein
MTRPEPDMTQPMIMLIPTSTPTTRLCPSPALPQHPLNVSLPLCASSVVEPTNDQRILRCRASCATPCAAWQCGESEGGATACVLRRCGLPWDPVNASARAAGWLGIPLVLVLHGLAQHETGPRSWPWIAGVTRG